MAGLAATLIIIVLGAGLVAAVWTARHRGIGLPQAIALVKLTTLFRLRLPENLRGEAADLSSDGPVIHVYARQSGLDAAVLWAVLGRNCLHALADEDRRSVSLSVMRLFARTAAAGNTVAIEAALASGASVSIAFPHQVEPTPETLIRFAAVAALARKHKARLRALHVA